MPKITEKQRGDARAQLTALEHAGELDTLFFMLTDNQIAILAEDWNDTGAPPTDFAYPLDTSTSRIIK
jgi:hypothetical protein